MKLDGKFGGLLYKNNNTAQQWEPVFGLGFYADFSVLAANASALQVCDSHSALLEIPQY